MNDEIAIRARVSGPCETDPQLRGQFRPAGVDVDERDLRAGDLPAQIGDERAERNWQESSGLDSRSPEKQRQNAISSFTPAARPMDYERHSSWPETRRRSWK